MIDPCGIDKEERLPGGLPHTWGISRSLDRVVGARQNGADALTVLPNMNATIAFLPELVAAGLAFCLVFGATVAAVFLLHEQGAAWQHILRSARRFRLRSLLVVFTLSQVALAGWCTLRQREFTEERLLASVSLGCLLFVCWLVWNIFEEVALPTASRRFKTAIRPGRVRLWDSKDRSAPAKVERADEPGHEGPVGRDTPG